MELVGLGGVGFRGGYFLRVVVRVIERILILFLQNLGFMPVEGVDGLGVVEGESR